MKSIRRYTLLLFAVVFVLVSNRSARAQASLDVIEVDHAARTARVISADKPTTIREDDEIPLRPSSRLLVRVVNTNTALYAFKVTSEKVEGSTATEFKSFLSELKPYLTDIPTVALARDPDLAPQGMEGMVGFLDEPIEEYRALMMREEPLTSEEALRILANLKPAIDWIKAEWGQIDFQARLFEDVEAQADDVNASLKRLNGYLFYGSEDSLLSLRQIQMHTLEALDDMYDLMGKDSTLVRQRGQALRKRLGWNFKEDGRLRNVGRVMNTLQDLNRDLAILQGTMSALRQQFAAGTPGAESPLEQLRDFEREIEEVLRTYQRVEPTEINIEGITDPEEVAFRRDALAVTTAEREIREIARQVRNVREKIEKTGEYLKGLDGGVVTEAKKALEKTDKMLASAYAVERLAAKTIKAVPTWTSPDTVQVSWDKGRKLTIEVTKGDVDETARLADRRPLTFTTTVQPDWVVRPAVDLNVAYVPKANYQTFEAQEIGEEKRVAAQNRDVRFTYLLGLALTWRRFDGRRTSGWALWAPEFVLNPSSDDRGFGVGMGLSYRVFKVSFGALWTKHQKSNGLSEGDLISAEHPLTITETYGKPRLYLGFTVRGWLPYAKK